jgi:hypothetical protein
MRIEDCKVGKEVVGSASVEAGAEGVGKADIRELLSGPEYGTLSETRCSVASAL